MIAAVYIGFAVADGRWSVLVVESTSIGGVPRANHSHGRLADGATRSLPVLGALGKGGPVTVCTSGDEVLEAKARSAGKSRAESGDGASYQARRCEVGLPRGVESDCAQRGCALCDSHALRGSSG